jgi:hypothetical protein
VSHRWIWALAAALLVFAGDLQPAAAGGAYLVSFYSSCGPRLDYCLPVCDAMLPGGFALGRCYDRCSISEGICEASRIPVPGRRTHR